MSAEDTIQEFAPALRAASQMEALRIALQILGELCEFGITYSDFDSTGYLKTTTEASSGNSALMRNIACYEHGLERSIVRHRAPTRCRFVDHANRSCRVESKTAGLVVQDPGPPKAGEVPSHFLSKRRAIGRQERKRIFIKLYAFTRRADDSVCRRHVLC